MPLIRKGATPSGGAGPAATTPALTSSSADERWAAARAVGAAEDVPGLREALAREVDARVREAILTTLARIATLESAQTVIPYIRSDDAGLRTAALDALRAMPGPTAELLPELLSDGDADVRLLACELARNVPVAQASRMLSELVAREAEVNVCAAAIEVLAEVGGPGALPALAEAASRFGHEPFVVYSIEAVAERIRSGSSHLG